MNSLSMSGKRALITGGGSGIGKAISSRFARQGAHVVIVELDEASGAVCADEIRSAGGLAEVAVCDVSNHHQVKEVVDNIQRQHGAVDILVNNAGVAHIGTAVSTSVEDFDKLYQINVRGAFNMMQAVLPRMLERGAGVILNMASVAASVGIPDRFAYSMTKGAIISMTYSVARDFVEKGIRCNSISPARVHTPFVDGFLKKNYPGKESEMFEKLSATQPIGRMGQPDEIAGLALYLCSDEAAFITGCDYPVDGGFIRLNT
jgi:NAD(P)-dependent dehydrogenase (short-subunit alcohol dehydrogenase family)